MTEALTVYIHVSQLMPSIILPEPHVITSEQDFFLHIHKKPKCFVIKPEDELSDFYVA